MGRSVASPADPDTITCYQELDFDDFDDDMSREDDWDWYLDDIRDRAARLFPSMRHQNVWTGRELRIICVNDHASVVVSEYCGLVSISLVPAYNGLARAWVAKVAAKFHKEFGTLRSLGWMSNGEQVFERI